MSPQIDAVLANRALGIRLPEAELIEAPLEAGSIPLLFPGSFNPFHHGHRRMIELAERESGHRVALEVAVRNVDKPPLDRSQIARRVAQLAGLTRDARRHFFLTATPRFAEKAELFRGTTFLVGADTIVRLCNASYYGNDAAACDAAIDAIKRHRCRFLVFGRRIGNDFVAGEEIAIPEKLKEISTFIQATKFRVDISSSEIRKNDLGAGGTPE